ncbi:MAG TPA: RsmD family RNA methyltransferase [Cyclobacteriaceae bacterium]|jgi:16S rRNA (guanine(966)-N(2))-methyltransferase RsmD|nr:RsmD family RNA methyltransferase [Cyclobacteriaceae bacterium]
MRVISGKLGGRKFYPPNNLPTRPTTDFAKTGLFNILNNYYDFSEISFLDLFSGTGSLSYEFASRGSPRIVAVDQDKGAIEFIKKMKIEWNIPTLEVNRSDVFRFLERNTEPFDVIFAGPPYPLETIDDLPAKVLEKNILKEGGMFILETSPKHQYKDHPHFLQVRNYGQTHFHFFSAKKNNAQIPTRNDVDP